MLDVLALPLEEGKKRLEACGLRCHCTYLLPPRETLAAYQERRVRKYIVRQRQLSDNEVELTIALR